MKYMFELVKDERDSFGDQIIQMKVVCIKSEETILEYGTINHEGHHKTILEFIKIMKIKLKGLI